MMDMNSRIIVLFLVDKLEGLLSVFTMHSIIKMHAIVEINPTRIKWKSI